MACHVYLDDAALWKDVKLWALEHGVTVKVVVDRALRAYLGGSDAAVSRTSDQRSVGRVLSNPHSADEAPLQDTPVRVRRASRPARRVQPNLHSSVPKSRAEKPHQIPPEATALGSLAAPVGGVPVSASRLAETSRPVIFEGTVPSTGEPTRLELRTTDPPRQETVDLIRADMARGMDAIEDGLRVQPDPSKKGLDF